MPWLNQVTGLRVRCNGRLNRACAVRCTDARGHALGRLDTQGKVGSVAGLVITDHQP